MIKVYHIREIRINSGKSFTSVHNLCSKSEIFKYRSTPNYESLLIITSQKGCRNYDDRVKKY